MSKLKSIEEMIEEKREAMMGADDSLNINSIYRDIKALAKTMSNEPVWVEVPCKQFYKVGEKDFVVLLYRKILSREPDPRGYIDTLNLVLSKTRTRAQLIQGFAQSEEGIYRNIKLTGLDKEIRKERIKNFIKRIPVVGYLVRWTSNIIFLSRRLAALSDSYNFLNLHVENMDLQLKDTEQQSRQANYHCDVLEDKFRHAIWWSDHLDEQRAEVTAQLEQKLETVKQGQQESTKSYAELEEKYKKTVTQYHELQKAYDITKKQLVVCMDYVQNKTKQENELQEVAKINSELCDQFYLHYNEELMPDSRDEVKGRAVPYIEKIRSWYNGYAGTEDSPKFVDLGCGECEWIELLSENGFAAVGVDSNVHVVNKVRKNFPEFSIECEDAITYLKQCEDNSVDLISSFHMVEHMDFLTIITLLKECYRTLKKGGMLIIETPNPQNILITTYYFNLDPTHNKPIPIELMSYFMEESGFEVKEKLMLNPLNFVPYEYKAEDPIKDIVFRFNLEQAYSIMAVKK